MNPSDATSGCALRVWAIKYHPEKEDIFVTGGWENHLKVDTFLIIYYIKLTLNFGILSVNQLIFYTYLVYMNYLCLNLQCRYR